LTAQHPEKFTDRQANNGHGMRCQTRCQLLGS
jgi:hypothetical protein